VLAIRSLLSSLRKAMPSGRVSESTISDVLPPLILYTPWCGISLEGSLSCLGGPYGGSVKNTSPLLRTTTSLGLLSFFPLQRSEEHTSELQSRENLVCRLL